MAAAALGGIYFAYFHGKNSAKSGSSDIIKAQPAKVEESSVPQTPLEKAVAIKNRGNKNFKARRYQQAYDCYTEALEKCPAEAGAVVSI